MTSSVAAAIAPSLLLLPPPKSLLFSNSKPYHSQSLTLLPLSRSLGRISHKSPQHWRIYAVTDNPPPPEAPIDASQLPAAAADDSVSVTVSYLLFIAFIGLSLLTIGVIYLAVQDFLAKREREKFENEQAEKKKMVTATKKRRKKRNFRERVNLQIQGLEDDDDDDD